VETDYSHCYYCNAVHRYECVWVRGKNRGATILDTIIRFLGTACVLFHLPWSCNCYYPGTIFGVIAGALFGSVIGVILISISSTIGASLTFLIARYFARDTVARWLSKNKTMERLDRLTEEQGMVIVG